MSSQLPQNERTIRSLINNLQINQINNQNQIRNNQVMPTQVENEYQSEQQQMIIGNTQIQVTRWQSSVRKHSLRPCGIEHTLHNNAVDKYFFICGQIKDDDPEQKIVTINCCCLIFKILDFHMLMFQYFVHYLEQTNWKTIFAIVIALVLMILPIVNIIFLSFLSFVMLNYLVTFIIYIYNNIVAVNPFRYMLYVSESTLEEKDPGYINNYFTFTRTTLQSGGIQFISQDKIQKIQIMINSYSLSQEEFTFNMYSDTYRSYYYTNLPKHFLIQCIQFILTVVLVVYINNALFGGIRSQ